MINDQMPVVGKLTLTLRDAAGMVKQEVAKDNLIVQVGKNFLASAVLNSSASPFTYMAVGTNGTAAALSDTTLGTELVRQVFTTSSVSTNVVT